MTAEVDNARTYSLQAAAAAFDSIYTRSMKLLQIPYTEEDILSVLSNETAPSADDPRRRQGSGVVFNELYPKVLFYSPNISAITLVSEMSGRIFYSRQYPARTINGRNPDLEDLRKSWWYAEAMAMDAPFIAPAIDNELFLGSGITTTLAQRLIDIRTGRRVGVIRIDLNLSTFYEEWSELSKNDSDVVAVADQTGLLVFSNSSEFSASYPPLSSQNEQPWRQSYRINSYTAPESGFTFYYLATARNFNFWLLYGLPALFLLLSGAYALLYIFRSSRSISNPVLKLKAAMIQGQQKDLSARCEPLEGELGELSEAFNDLMSQMSELVAEVTATEQEKANLRYEVLRSKVSPHFLYNTINAIRWKANLLGAKEVGSALEKLVSLLRFTIKTTRDTIPFALELEQLENYVQVMRVRYDNSIDLDYDIDDNCMNYQCLKFLLQPIVENCFIHAFQSSNRTDRAIMVKASAEPDCIRIVVEDNGSGMEQDKIERLFSSGERKDKALFDSIGIDNVHQRIRTLFGPEYGLTIESEPGVYTRVTAVIPKMPLEEVQNEDSSGG